MRPLLYGRPTWRQWQSSHERRGPHERGVGARVGVEARFLHLLEQAHARLHLPALGAGGDERVVRVVVRRHRRSLHVLIPSELDPRPKRPRPTQDRKRKDGVAATLVHPSGRPPPAIKRATSS
eukprot:1194134-Prorocentrum_minimum.AAC.4